jgi:hypothetical protein
MLLQLSEWQQATTSLRIATKRKRTKGSPVSKKQNGGHNLDILPVAVSFVPSTRQPRPSKRRKSDAKDPDEVHPLLAVTASHGIIVLGKLQSQNGVFRESAKMQYSSRPGKQSAFLPEAAASDCSLPRIAAVVKGDQVYALQNQNKVIASWSAASEGPDDSTIAGVAKLSLPETAMSMGVVGKNKTILYGTLSDGRCYVGFWATDTADSAAGGNSLKSHVFKSPHGKDKRHISTVMLPVSNPGKGGGKRKVSETSDENFVLSQVFADKSGFTIIKYQLRVVRGSVELKDNGMSTSCMEVTPKEAPDISIDPAHALFAQDSNFLTIMYEEVTRKEIINGKKTKTETRVHKICHLSLSDGLLKADPFEVPASTRHFGFVAENLLALATIDSILFFELARGILIRSINVSDVVSDTKDWSLITDSKKGTIVIVSAQPTNLHVAVATVSIKAGDSRRNEFTLADGLRASMISNSHIVVDSEATPTRDLMCFETILKNSEEPAHSQKSVAVSDALASISTCLDNVLDPKDATIKENLLLSAYESALAKVVPAPLSPKKRNGEKQDKNGTHNKIPKHSSENDAFSDRGETPPTAPQEFIDGATTLMLAAMQLPMIESKVVDTKITHAKLDARLILYRLIRSGKVSARRHFQVFSDDDSNNDLLFSVLRAMELNNKCGQRTVSAVDLIHEMLTSCADITERQLVTMIHYTMCKALPEDLAESILGWQRFSADHPYSMLAKEFSELHSAQQKLKDGSKKCFEAQKDVEKLSPKILKVGLAFLVERIVMYSKPNESLLRIALSQGLTNQCEAPTLAKILLELLGHETDNVAGRRCYVAATKWIFILCEACREALSHESSGDKSHLSVVFDRLKQSVDQNNRIITLGPALASVRGALARDKEEDYGSVGEPQKVAKIGRVPKDPTPKKLAAYSIEQLIF